jgi:hypothetical protein
VRTSSFPGRLRLTVERLQRPETWPRLFDYGLEERDGLAFMGGPMIVSGGEAMNRLPLELLPELADVDLESGDAILAFAKRYGVLGAWRHEFRVMDFVSAQTGGDPGTGGWMPFGREPLLERTGIDVVRLIRIRQEQAGVGSDPNGEFVDEFRIAAAGLLGLLAIQRELEAPRFSPGRLARLWPRSCPWPTPKTKEQAWRNLVDLVNAAVASASLSLAWVRDEEIATGQERGFHPGPPVAPVLAAPATLYGVCGLELADHILADDPWRICANETCGRLFSVQEGRGRWYHRTDNLKFHSPACKDAQAAREYRRRQSAKKEKAR